MTRPAGICQIQTYPPDRSDIPLSLSNTPVGCPSFVCGTISAPLLPRDESVVSSDEPVSTARRTLHFGVGADQHLRVASILIE